MRKLVLEGNREASILLNREYSLKWEDIQFYDLALQKNQNAIKFLSNEFWEFKEKNERKI